MRDYAILLLTALTLLLVTSNMVSGSADQLQMPQDLIQPAQPGAFSGRALRTIETNDQPSDPNDEERTITEPLLGPTLTTTNAKRLGTWARDNKLGAYIKLMSIAGDDLHTMAIFLNRRISPDVVFRHLSLRKEGNRYRWFSKEDSSAFFLWKKYVRVWEGKYPQWETTIPSTSKLLGNHDPKHFETLE